jgi:hypothetical protein
LGENWKELKQAYINDNKFPPNIKIPDRLTLSPKLPQTTQEEWLNFVKRVCIN